MKFKIFSTLNIVFLAIVLVSCEDSELTPTENNLSSEFGNYTKELLVFDINRGSSATIKIGSNDLSILDMWTADNFELMLLKEGQTLSDVINIDEQEGEVPNTDLSADDDIVASEVSIKILSKNLEEGIKRIALTTKPPYDEDMRGWSYNTYYSDAVSGNTVTVNVFGHNGWHRGYWSASYKKYRDEHLYTY